MHSSSLLPSAAISVLVHATLIGGVLFVVKGQSRALPPVYRVNLVAAPAGARSVGQIQPENAPPAAPAAPVPKSTEDKAENVIRSKAPPPKRTPPPPATRVPNAASAKPNAPAPRAGGGETGGKGTDVANVRTEGIAFPYPGYLNNIANQILLNFDTSESRPLRCEVFFLIHRDGSISDFEIRRRSGSSAFDIAARGAVEAASRARAFGPLPDGFNDDVLPVIFTFVPDMIR